MSDDGTAIADGAAEGVTGDPIAVVDSPATSGAQLDFLAERFHIRFDSPLPGFDTPQARAFLASDEREGASSCFALICQFGVPHRPKPLAQLIAKEGPNMLRLLAAGVVNAPSHGGRRLALVFQQPQGGRLSEATLANGQPLPETLVISSLLPDLVAALQYYEERDVVHRAVRPDNLFFLDSGRRAILLGECITSPPGSDQPAAYEPIERTVAVPSGRGQGTRASDCFALGVTLVALLTGRDPTAGRTDKELFQQRIEKGSYWVLASETGLPGSSRDLIKGLLCDTPENRWTLDDVKQWCRTKSLSPRPGEVAQRAKRPFQFCNEDYYFDRSLTIALSRRTAEAIEVVKSGKLEAWVRGGLDDSQTADRIADLTEDAKKKRTQGEQGQGEGDVLVSHVCRVIDPASPIFYRGLFVSVDGLGPALAEMIRRNDQAGLEIFKELLLTDLPGAWLVSRQLSGVKKSAAEGQILRLRGYLANQALGNGMERCLYELNPALPCVSRFVEGDHATDIRSLIKALDAVSRTADSSTNLVDRHVAAYIAEKWENGVRRLSAITKAGSDDAQRRCAILHLFADLQKSQDSGPLPGLSAWLASYLMPVAEGFHNRLQRQALTTKLENLAPQGDLVAIDKLFRGRQTHALDARAYKQAVTDYAVMEHVIEAYKTGTRARAELAVRIAAKYAVSVGYSLLTLSLLGVSAAAVL